MPIDWSRVITVEDEDTANVITGKSILYIRTAGGGGVDGAALSESIADPYNTSTQYVAGDCVMIDGLLYRFEPTPYEGFDQIDPTEITASGEALEGDYLTYSGTLYIVIADNNVHWSSDTAAHAVDSLLAFDQIQVVTPGAYDPTATYNVGDVVEIDGIYYEYVGQGGGLIQNQVQACDLIWERVPKSMIAPVFDATAAYSVGDVVIYGDGLYRFTSAHAAGAWNSSDVTQTTIIAEIQRGA